MKKYLFEGFLKDKKVYQVCKIYWEIKLEELFSLNKIEEYNPYLNTKFGDGTDFFNGNPIVNYRINKLGRGIRIIQEEPNPDDLKVVAWIDEFETDLNKTIELVISIQLNPSTERIAFDLIKKWVIDVFPKDKMEKFIELKLELGKLEMEEKVKLEVQKV
ncbi:MAG: hypothetical protein H7A23_10035 [Leptospiraceae bacterium]|nr:hypothetical protein [Leptospiraceae bacterium]